MTARALVRLLMIALTISLAAVPDAVAGVGHLHAVVDLQHHESNRFDNVTNPFNLADEWS